MLIAANDLITAGKSRLNVNLFKLDKEEHIVSKSAMGVIKMIDIRYDQALINRHTAPLIVPLSGVWQRLLCFHPKVKDNHPNRVYIL